MSEKVGVLSADLDVTLMNLGKFDAAAEQHFRPALRQAVSQLVKVARPKVPSMTGKARKALSTTVTGKGLMMSGYVGWKKGPGSPWYINVVEYGAKPHTMDSGKKHTKKAQFYEQEYIRSVQGGSKMGGVPIYVRGIGYRIIRVHPGFPARKMLTSSYEEKQGDVEQMFTKASDQVLAEVGRGA